MDFIKELGLKLQNELNLIEKRLYMQGLSSYEDTLESIYRVYPELEGYEKEEIVRNCGSNYFMNYHIDKCNIVRKNGKPFKFPLFNKGRNLHYQNEKYLIFHNKPLPNYTLLYYEGEFEGGELSFLDKIYKVKNGDAFLFDSFDCHSVLPMKSGIRKVYLTLFYDKKATEEPKIYPAIN